MESVETSVVVAEESEKATGLIGESMFSHLLGLPVDGLQSIHFLPALAHEHQRQRPLLMHEQHRPGILPCLRL